MKTTMELWIAREQDELLQISLEKPFYNENCDVWDTENETYKLLLPFNWIDKFPEVTFKNSPQKVVLMTQEELKDQKHDAYILGVTSAILEKK